MPTVALVPTGKVNAQKGKFTHADALVDVPDDWKPRSNDINPESFPSPYGRWEATMYLCGRGEFLEPLALASATLLKGLVGGLLYFRWLSAADMKSVELKQLLDSTLTTQFPEWPFFGLITDADDKAWGYMLEGPVPVLAGARADDWRQLEELVSKRVKISTIAAMLGPIRDDLKGRNRWSPDKDHPWMMLFDNVLKDAAADRDRQTLDMRIDVRSWGPFQFKSSSSSGSNSEVFYLPALAPGFVPQVTDTLLHSEPHQPEGTGHVEYIASNPNRRVRVIARPVQLDKDSRALDGIVLGKFESPARPGDFKATQLAQSQILGTFEHHLNKVRNMAERLETEPHRFSDVQRIVALYAPDRLGGAPNAPTSPALRDFLGRIGHASTLSNVETNDLLQNGHAFRLRTQNATFLFVESWPKHAAHCVGDLSLLGFALFRMFAIENAPGGTKWLNRATDGFPFLFHPSLGPDLDSAEVRRDVLNRLATLHRLLRVYQPPHPDTYEGGWDELAHTAIKFFVLRIFQGGGSLQEKSRDTLLAPRSIITVIDGEMVGEFRTRIDPFRSNRNLGK